METRVFVNFKENLHTIVPNFCCNDELSSTMGGVGCLLTDSVLPDT